MEFGGPYTDHKDKDERLWAAVELYKATGQEKYHDYIKRNILSILDERRFGDGAPEWNNVNFLALFSYVKSNKADSMLKKTVETRLKQYGDYLIALQKNNPYQITYAGNGNSFNWGSNSVIVTTGLELLYIYRITGKDKYKKAAFNILNYLLGMNPNKISYITGFGDNTAKNPHFRPFLSGKYKLPEGMLIGGPNNVEHKGDLPAMGLSKQPPMRIYADHKDSWATNEVAINWQANLASFMALLLQN
jgi:endoglucanase